MKITDLIEDFNPLYLEDFTYKDHPSYFVDNGQYQVFIMRYFLFGKEGLDHNSLAYIFFDQKIYKYIRESDEIELVTESFELIHKEIFSAHLQNREIIEKYVDEIDLLEDKVYQRQIPRSFMDTWFDIRKDMLKIERYYQKNMNVIRDFFKFHLLREDFLISEFKDLEEMASLNLSKVTGRLERLNSIYSYYESVKNDHLSKNLYVLTIISAVFLPLNLIVGFFGMNTNGLYLKDNPDGTYYATLILIIALIVTMMGLKIVKLFDHYVMGKMFKRYDLYKNISKKLNDLMDSD